MANKGGKDLNTVRLQNLMRRLDLVSIDRSYFNLLDELLAQRGYIIYRNDQDVLMIRKNKDSQGLNPREVTSILRGEDIASMLERDDDHE